MSDKTPAIVRTIVPIIVGNVLTKVIPGLDPTDPFVNTLVDTAVSGVYYVGVRYLEEYNPKLGYLLGIAKKPAYSTEPAPSPGPDEHLEAVVVDDAPVEGDEFVEPDAP